MCRQLVCWPCLFVMLYLYAQLSQSLHTFQIDACVLPYSTWIQREHLSIIVAMPMGTYSKLHTILKSEDGAVVFTAYAQTHRVRITIGIIYLDFVFGMSRIYHFFANFLKLYFAGDSCCLFCLQEPEVLQSLCKLIHPFSQKNKTSSFVINLSLVQVSAFLFLETGPRGIYRCACS